MVRDSRLRACLFLVKSYNAHVRVTQKDACLTLVLLTGLGAPGPPNHVCARPVTLQILLSGSRLFRPPCVGSLQDTFLGLSKFPILFLCEVFFANVLIGRAG